ncbi:MAG: diguanylate cyclase [Thermomonas sp.]
MNDTTVSEAGWSLRQRLKWGLVAAALVPALLFGLTLLSSEWRAERDSIVVRLDANARLNASTMDDFLEAQLAGVQLVAEQETSDDEVAVQHLNDLLRAYPAMLYAIYTDSRGEILTAADTRGRPPPADFPGMGGEEWFQEVIDQRRPVISGVHRSLMFEQGGHVAVSAPIVRDGRLEAVLEASIPVQSIARLTADNLARRNFSLLLLDRANRVVYAGPSLRWKILDSTGQTGAALRHEASLASTKVETFIRSDLLRMDEPAFVSAVAMRNGWVLALVTPRQQLLASLFSRLWLLSALLGVTFLGVLWAVWRQKRLLHDNIDYLVASLKGYALGGRLVPEAESRLPEELQPLALGIGELGARMNAAYLELRLVLDAREHVIAERTESLHQAVAQLNELSRTDALTNALNYRGFLEAGERLWRQTDENGAQLAVLALDIDFFKRYNDLYGHAEGDGALRRFAGAVRSALLHADDVLARPGGEEFIVFLPGSTHEQAIQVAERVCRRVRDADIIHAASPQGRMTVSIGVAAREPGDIEPEDMLKRADQALYRAKAAGRDQVAT